MTHIDGVDDILDIVERTAKLAWFDGQTIAAVYVSPGMRDLFDKASKTPWYTGPLFPGMFIQTAFQSVPVLTDPTLSFSAYRFT